MFKSPAENKSQGTLETTSKGGTLTRSVTHFVFTEEYFGRSSFFILIFTEKKRGLGKSGVWGPFKASSALPYYNLSLI